VPLAAALIVAIGIHQSDSAARRFDAEVRVKKEPDPFATASSDKVNPEIRRCRI
jgi:hypothetical protein